MKCANCDRTATIHLSEWSEGKLRTLNLCDECARRHRMMDQPMGFGLTDLLAGLSDFVHSSPEFAGTETEQECPRCGISFSRFRNSGLLGCAECYLTFRHHVADLLKGIHGSNRHGGKKPLVIVPLGESGAEQGPLRLGDLQMELQEAVEREDFERAIELRDRIRSLEKGGGNP